jgi:hypothetical protein
LKENKGVLEQIADMVYNIVNDSKENDMMFDQKI